MITSLTLLAVIAGLGLLTYLYNRLPQRGQIAVVAAMFLAIMSTAMASPAFAAAVDDNTLSQDQKALNETLKTTPQDNQYQGIEYPQAKGEPLTDREITRRVQQEIPNNVKLSVSNGSVRLSGKVNSRNEAQRIVQDIKELPGVHEISYDLGLRS